MTEERKHAILLATVILTARRLQPLLEAVDEAGKPNMATEYWAEVYTKKIYGEGGAHPRSYLRQVARLNKNMLLPFHLNDLDRRLICYMQ